MCFMMRVTHHRSFGVNTGKDECQDDVDCVYFLPAMKTFRININDFKIMRLVKCECIRYTIMSSGASNDF